MARRFFSADFHLGMQSILDIEHRPFNNVEDMNSFLIGQCEKLAADDTMVHVGDLASYGFDRSSGSHGLDVKPAELLSGVKAAFVNIRGNHDISNKVKSLCDSMRTSLGKRYPSVSVGHYPTYDKRCVGHFHRCDIHICGHVHGAWRHCLDLDRQCLNINVGCDAWNYRILSEDDIISYVSMLLRHKPDALYRCRVVNWKPVFIGDSKKFFE